MGFQNWQHNCWLQITSSKRIHTNHEPCVHIYLFMYVFTNLDIYGNHLYFFMTYVEADVLFTIAFGSIFACPRRGCLKNYRMDSNETFMADQPHISHEQIKFRGQSGTGLRIICYIHFTLHGYYLTLHFKYFPVTSN